MKVINFSKRQQIVSKINFTFDEKIKTNFYTTDYFLKAKNVLNNKNINEVTTMQFICFNSTPFMMCGGYEIKALLEFYLTQEQLNRTELYLLEEGTIVDDQQTPLVIIKGYYLDFMCLENIIDGILTRRCSVATNCMQAIKALLPHQNIIYMADRNCDYFNQSYDAYPAYLAGIDLFVTAAQIDLIKSDHNTKVIGTVPHSLIQQYRNNLGLMISDFSEVNKTKEIMCLIDYENYALKTLDQLLPSFNLLAGIRLDTSSNLVDQSLKNQNLFGVNFELINLVKEWLIKHKLENKKIVVTSKVTPQKIHDINMHTDVVDYYGVGSFFLTTSVHVSADLVEINNQHEAKFGRKLLANAHLLHKVEWN